MSELTLKNFLPRPLRHMLARVWAFPRGVAARYALRVRGRRIARYLEATRERGNIVIFGTPEHGNIGDHAIVLAEREFFKKHFPERNVVEVVDSVFPAAEKDFRALSGNAVLTTSSSPCPAAGFLEIFGFLKNICCASF